MAGNIYHSWNAEGTILTITSDSGTSSSSNLKGDDGPRGVQGPAGIALFNGGSLDLTGYATEEWVERKYTNVDLTGYATEDYVVRQIANIPEVDLSDYYTKAQTNAIIPNISGYATEAFVTNKIAAAQLSGGGSGNVDLSGYATKDDLNKYRLKTDVNFTSLMINNKAVATQEYVNNALAALVGDEEDY